MSIATYPTVAHIPTMISIITTLFGKPSFQRRLRLTNAGEDELLVVAETGELLLGIFRRRGA